jgi:hypothetical protein
MRSAIGAAFLSLALSTAAHSNRQQPLQETILFPNPRGGHAYSATWKEVPSPDQIRQALPKDVDVVGDTDWMCHVSLGGGSMTARWKPLGHAITDMKLRAEEFSNYLCCPKLPREMRDQQRSRKFQIGFSKPGLKPADMSSCPPPFCTPSVPPPPPPPLPHE